MVLFNKQVLVDSLLKHLEVEGTTAVDGLMDGLVGLAKDLEEELYPWFPQLLEAMVPFLDSDDAKAVEVSSSFAKDLISICFGFLRANVFRRLPVLLPSACSVDQVLFSTPGPGLYRDLRVSGSLSNDLLSS